ncbi:ATP synthase F1 subunit gamma [Verrucomicrobia bacterium LW23]|nr:ATP synthase F1 subunit gamma [Verrucomicrobia bacterium LW23]
MASQRDIRRRIKSVKNTAQITKAMQMVAASRMRKAQQQALAGRSYSDLLDQMAHSLFGHSGDVQHPLLQERPVKKTLSLVITTDKGLCGGLNGNLLREVLRADNPNKVYVTIGRKGRQSLARAGRPLLADFELKDGFTFRDSKIVSRYCLQQFENGDVDEIEVFYSKFVNTISQVPTRVRIAPIGSASLVSSKAAAEAAHAEGPTEYQFEPPAPELLGHLLPFYVHFEIYQYVLDARASEHSARMVAMKNATDNAKQLVKDLTLQYNKARQAAITTEILEIASAAAQDA